VLEQDEVHGDEDGHVMMVIKALNLEKKKEKEIGLRQRYI
jgi:hypothetical protein